MTDPTAGAPAPAPEELQFDRAERAFRTAGSECAVCKQPITTSYFEINGKIACARCRGRVLAVWNRGSPAQRGAKAVGLGALAAALGAAVYFGIAALTGYEFGLIAVLVGLAVGIAVRKGSSGRGGWRYQLLAMFLHLQRDRRDRLGPGAVARFGAWVNLFNLTPVWQLDGGRGFRALTRVQRWIAVTVIAAT